MQHSIIMKRAKHITKLLTVISFLLILMAGEKFSVPMFLFLLWTPMLVIDGSGNVLNLPLSPAITILLDFIYLGLIYFAIIQLLRSFYLQLNSPKNNKLNLFGLLVLVLVASRAIPGAHEATSSLISIIVFFFLATTNLVLTIIDLQKKSMP